MGNYIVTGVSGSGRRSLLNGLQEEIVNRGETVRGYNLGQYIWREAERLRIDVSDQKILDIDRSLLRALRRLALDAIGNHISTGGARYNLLGIHATFRWRGRLIEGLSSFDLRQLKVRWFLNVVDDLRAIYETNLSNPKWQDVGAPGLEETNHWIMEEEFLSEVFAEFFDVPMFLVGRRHRLPNLADLFLTDKPKIYLSYPITHIREEHPELLARIQDEILPALESRFVVFDPLVIGDMEFAYPEDYELPAHLSEISPETLELVRARTVERDYQFIDQSDAVIVIYLTEKISPGVLSEVVYACKHSKPVFMVFPFSRSPFLLECVTSLFDNEDDLFSYLDAGDFSERLKVRRGFH